MKLKIHIASEVFLAEASSEDLEALIRIMRSTNYISWGWSRLGDAEFVNATRERNELAMAPLKPRKIKWWKL